MSAPAPPDLILRSRRVVAGERLGPAAIHVHRGQIQRLAGHDELFPGCPLEDYGDLVIMPGLVDSHVHINEPGRTEWEGFDTATRAAAAGGVTTLMDMPLNSIPPTTTARGLLEKAAASEGQLHVDVALCGGVVPGNLKELRQLAREGAFAFKCFLSDSGVAEFPHVTEDDLRPAMRELAELGLPLLCHAELPGPLAAAAALGLQDDPRRYASYLRSRPKEAEDRAVELVLGLCRDLSARAHIVHLSSAGALPMLLAAKEAGVRISAETCPHYLTLAAEEIPDGATAFKCAPPIREADNRDALWVALAGGLLDQVVTDHSPSSLSLKCTGTGDFMKAWGGISSLQLGLPAVFTEARRRGHTVVDVARWMCQGPAELLGLKGRKGLLAAGADADLCVWDPDAVFTVAAARLQHKNRLTPYEGRALQGVVRATYLRGHKIYDNGQLVATQAGSWLRRGS